MSENKIPNSDIIGYEGPVGHEKSIHKTHFGGVERTWKSTPAEWVEVAPGRWRLVPKKAREARRKAEEI